MGRLYLRLSRYPRHSFQLRSQQISIVQSGETEITLPDESEWIELPMRMVIKDHPTFSITVKSAASFDVYNYTAVNTANANSAGSGILSQPVSINFWTSVETNSTTHLIQGTVSPISAGIFQTKIHVAHGLASSGSSLPTPTQS
ncbi:hypothetical protein BDZ89DRAFT_1144320 [Hymenopellis radicata]|nr:hypothetical protein BDZ89DRAFT_1144320 [Hymenopellis radicata]